MKSQEAILLNPTDNSKKILCPICKDGQNCADLISHAKEWNTK